jgi:DNA polymerase-1
MQLVEDGHVDMLDTMNDRRIDEAAVNEKFGVGPEKVGEVLALMGDSVDNVPGVPGVGPKTATQLIQQYGTVEAVLASVEEISKPKLKQNLIEHADNARLSRELVRLVCDAPLPEPLEDLALKGVPPEPLKEFLEDQGFKSLLNRMIGGSSLGRWTASRPPLRSRWSPKARRRSRSTSRNMRPSSTKPRSTAGSRRHGNRVMSRSIRRPTASTASSPGSPASASPRLRIAPATCP